MSIKEFDPDEEHKLWGRVFEIPIKQGDTIRFKYGKVIWTVVYCSKLEGWNHRYARLKRYTKPTSMWSYSEPVYKTIYEYSIEWENMQVLAHA